MDRYGTRSIVLRVAGLQHAPQWSMARNHQSPRYTTEWDELPLIKAC
ncbi:MAG: polymerase [Micrococcaceae bacterium]|nr:polymerase [Micrococcaceae bacterium]